MVDAGECVCGCYWTFRVGGFEEHCGRAGMRPREGGVDGKE